MRIDNPTSLINEDVKSFKKKIIIVAICCYIASLILKIVYYFNHPWPLNMPHWKELVVFILRIISFVISLLPAVSFILSLLIDDQVLDVLLLWNAELKNFYLQTDHQGFQHSLHNHVV